MFNFIGGIIGGVFEFFTKNEVARQLAVQVVLKAATQVTQDNTSKIDDHIPQVLSELANDNKVSTKTLQKVAKTINDENLHMPNVKVEVGDDRTLNFKTFKL